MGSEPRGERGSVTGTRAGSGAVLLGDPASSPLLADLLAIVMHWQVIGDKYFLVHHCTSLYAFFLVLVSAGARPPQTNSSRARGLPAGCPLAPGQHRTFPRRPRGARAGSHAPRKADGPRFLNFHRKPSGLCGSCCLPVFPAACRANLPLTMATGRLLGRALKGMWPPHVGQSEP